MFARDHSIKHFHQRTEDSPLSTGEVQSCTVKLIVILRRLGLTWSLYSLLQHPVCGRGTNRLRKRLLAHVGACAESSYHAGEKYTFSFILEVPSPEIFAWGMPYILMYPTLYIIQWFSHNLDVCTQKCGRTVSDIYIWWSKSNVAYSGLKVIVSTMHLFCLVQCTVITGFNFQSSTSIPNKANLAKLSPSFHEQWNIAVSDLAFDTEPSPWIQR